MDYQYMTREFSIQSNFFFETSNFEQKLDNVLDECINELKLLCQKGYDYSYINNKDNLTKEFSDRTILSDDYCNKYPEAKKHGGVIERTTRRMVIKSNCPPIEFYKLGMKHWIYDK